MSANPPNYPWAEVFMEAALRAIRRLHYEYDIWAAGHSWMNDFKPGSLNPGSGIELAHEVTVCAAITQEFLKVGGVWVVKDTAEKVQDGLRFWGLEREEKYSDGAQIVDIRIQKYEQEEANKKPEPIGRKVLIEAKRARHFSRNILSGDVGEPRLRTSDVNKDNKKLLAEMNSRGTEEEQIYSHLLVC